VERVGDDVFELELIVDEDFKVVVWSDGVEVFDVILLIVCVMVFGVALGFVVVLIVVIGFVVAVVVVFVVFVVAAVVVVVFVVVVNDVVVATQLFTLSNTDGAAYSTVAPVTAFTLSSVRN